MNVLRKLRAYRAPLAVLLALMLAGAMLSVQLIGSGTSQSLGHSVTVRVSGLAAGQETTVALYAPAPSVQYRTTQNHVAVFDSVPNGYYTAYTDPGDRSGMGILNFSVSAPTNVTVQRQPLYEALVLVSGTEFAKATSAALLCNGQSLHIERSNIQNGMCTLAAPVGTHTLQMLGTGGAVLATRTVTVGNGDVFEEFVLGNPTAPQNGLAVKVTGGSVSSVTLRSEKSGAVYSAKVVGGAAQFRGIPSGDYLAEATGGSMGGYAVVQIPYHKEITIRLRSVYKVDVEITGKRASRAEYINYSFDNRQMIFSSEAKLSGRYDSLTLPTGSYTAYLYDSSRRVIARRSFRVSERNLDVRIELDSTSGSSSSGSWSSGSSWSSSRWPVASSSSSDRTAKPNDLTRAQAEAATDKALSTARKEGADTVTVRLKGTGYATKQRLRGLGENDRDLPVRLQADTMTTSGGKVEVRIELDPSKVDRDLKLYGSTTDQSAEKIRKKFRNWYANRICVIHLDQRSGWGQPVRVAARLDLDKFDTENLYLYSYNTADNAYRRIENPDYRIDSKGYLHFTTERGGDIVVSSGPLRK